MLDGSASLIGFARVAAWSKQLIWFARSQRKLAYMHGPFHLAAHLITAAFRC